MCDVGGEDNATGVKVAATRRNPLMRLLGKPYYHNNNHRRMWIQANLYRLPHLWDRARRLLSRLPDSNYARLGHEPYRRLIANMVTWAAGSLPLVRAESLLNTEIITNRLGKDLIVHLGQASHNVPSPLVCIRTADTIEEIVTLPNVRLTIPCT